MPTKPEILTGEKPVTSFSRQVTFRISPRADLILSHYRHELGDGTVKASESRVFELGLAALEASRLDLHVTKGQLAIFQAFRRELVNLNLKKLDAYMQQYKL